MVNYNDPIVLSRDFVAMVKLWHVIDGLYIWEFVTTLDYEWSFIRRRRPYRWTILLYSFARVATLFAFITNMIGFDISRPINCTLWVIFELIFAYAAVAAASLLIILRVIAIWNKNKIVYAVAMSAWVANITCLIHGIVLLRSIWSPLTNTCAVPNTTASKLNWIVALSTDIMMLLLMLLGLLRWRFESGGGGSSVGRFLWTQGLIWIFLVTIAYIPPVVFFLLDLNAPFNMMFQTPTLSVLTIAATRMYRSLSDFGSRDVVMSSIKGGGIPAPISLSQMEVVVHTDSEQYPTTQTSRYDSRIITDGLVHDKARGLNVKDDVERGVEK
ncbi:hypothetical protein BC827DRAFT_921301 [Russula dissimulans]|nr:hypothetical protein BC827DRAFT_921301 [Russula dissimulans]